MRRGRIAWIVVLVVLIGGGVALWRFLRDDGDGPVVYQTTPVGRGRLAAVIRGMHAQAATRAADPPASAVLLAAYLLGAAGVAGYAWIQN